MKQGIYILIILLFSSCVNVENQENESEIGSEIESIMNSENFKREISYEPISLNFKGKPILSLGQKVETLDTTLSFRYDPNGDFWDKVNLIKDHLSLDDNLSIELKQGSINGIFFFSSDQKENQIFNVAGNWTIGTKITEDNEAEIIEQIVEKLFPILRGQLRFEENWKYENPKKKYVEYFTMNPPKENGFYWTMDYEIKMK